MNKKTAIFAGGCFWCVEHDLKEVSGVINAFSGYAGGEGSPTYENHKGFREAVSVEYDPSKTTFKKLCQFFFDHIDPVDPGGQFFDRGESYKTGIYYQNNEERDVAESLIKELGESGLYNDPIAVEVIPFKNFYIAEEYHQEYSKKNPAHYAAYREGSGRAEAVARVCAIRDEKKMQWKD